MKNLKISAGFFIFLLGIFFLSHTQADSWAKPSPKASTSSSAEYLLRVSLVNKKPIATIYQFSSQGYKLKHSFRLKNKWYPVDVLVTNSGTVFTFDNWGNMGRGNVVTLYSPKGKVLRNYRLKKLYSRSDYKLIKKRSSASSINWRCAVTDPQNAGSVVYLFDSIGGRFEFDINTGKKSYQKIKGFNCTI